jgi:hypothetical protein
MRQIDLSGPDGNAFALIGLARSFCRQLYPNEWKAKAEEIIEDMMSGDYSHLVNVFDENFSQVIELLNRPEED